MISIYYLKILFPMQFLRTKLSQLKDYSKNILGKHNKIANSPKDMLEHLLKQQSEKQEYQIYLELGKISRGLESNTEIADFIVVKLEKFKYEPGVIKQTIKLLTVAIYLLKNGGRGFEIDLKNNLDLLEKMERVDSSCFEGKFNKKCKQLNYQLETIKQKAKYIHLLLTEEETLLEERQKATAIRETQETKDLPEDVAHTAIGLKIEGNKSSIETAAEKDQAETTYQQIRSKKP